MINCNIVILLSRNFFKTLVQKSNFNIRTKPIIPLYRVYNIEYHKNLPLISSITYNSLKYSVSYSSHI